MNSLDWFYKSVGWCERDVTWVSECNDLWYSVRELRLIVTPVSTRVHEAGLVARLIGRLETEIVDAVSHADVDTTRHCPPTQTYTNHHVNCSVTSQLLQSNCSRPAVSDNFGGAQADAESLPPVATVTDDAVLRLMTDSSTVWYRLSQESRHFLRSVRSLHSVNVSAHVLFADYSKIVDELTLLLPVDIVLPRPLLCGNAYTALFTSASGLLAVALAQRSAASHCLLGHVFHTCGGHLAAMERFHFRSNWSRVESELSDVRYCCSDSTTEQLYADTIECPRRVLAATSASMEQSRGCATADDVRRWYSACTELLNGTNRLTETLIGRTEETLAGAWSCCVSEIVIHTLLICLQVTFLSVSFQYTQLRLINPIQKNLTCLS